MKTKINIFLPLFALILSGCYGDGIFMNVGPRPIVHDEAQLRNVNRVCIMPVVEYPDQGLSRGAWWSVPDSLWGPGQYSESLTHSIWNHLYDEKIFSLIPIDSMVVAADAISKKDSVQPWETLAQRLHADAYIRIGFSYFHSPGPAKEPSADCFMRISDAKTGKTLMECEYDTYRGTCYWGPPRIEQVTNDAVDGAVELLVKAIIENRQ